MINFDEAVELVRSVAKPLGTEAVPLAPAEVAKDYEDRLRAGRREDTHGQDRARGICRAGEGEEIGNVGGRFADRARAIDVV